MRTAGPTLLLTLAVIVAACGGGTSMPSSSGSGAPGATETSAPATDAPASDASPTTASATGTPTDGPAAATEAPTDAPASEQPASEPATEPTEAPAIPTPSGPAGAAAACSGSDANRSFFAAAADAVSWPVLCAVLPKGWFVAEGSYRQANGGKLLIAYKGPGGATLSLSEGSFCTADDGCVPAGGDLGDASLGPLAGTLVGLDGGGFAIVVDRGLRPSWLMVTQGLDQAATLALGAALAEAGT